MALNEEHHSISACKKKNHQFKHKKAKNEKRTTIYLINKTTHITTQRLRLRFSVLNHFIFDIQITKLRQIIRFC